MIMSSPTKLNGNAVTAGREGTRIILKEITANSQSLSPSKHMNKSASDNPSKTLPIHEVKVNFTREFAEAASFPSIIPSSECNVISSASSIQSLTSTVSKSSSGICADTSTKSDTSYSNIEVSGIDDLVSACAGIQLNVTQNQEDLSFGDVSFLTADEGTIDESALLEDSPTLSYGNQTVTLNSTQTISDRNVSKTLSFGNQTINLNDTHNIYNETVNLNNTKVIFENQNTVDLNVTFESNESDKKYDDNTCQNDFVKQSFEHKSVELENDDINSETIITTETFNQSINSEELAQKILQQTNQLTNNDQEISIENFNSSSTISTDFLLTTGQVDFNNIKLENTNVDQNLPVEINNLNQTTDSTEVDSSTPVSIQPIENHSGELSIAKSVEEILSKSRELIEEIEPPETIEIKIKSEFEEDNNLLSDGQSLSNQTIENQETQSLEVHFNSPDLNQDKELLDKTSEINSTDSDKTITSHSPLNDSPSSPPPHPSKSVNHIETSVPNTPKRISFISYSKLLPERQSATLVFETENEEEEKEVTETNQDGVEIKEEEREKDLDEILSETINDQQFFDAETSLQINAHCDFEKLKAESELLLTNDFLKDNNSINDNEFAPATADIFNPSDFDIFYSQISNNSCSQLRSESLYLHFDPLVSNSIKMLPQSNGTMPQLNEEKNGETQAMPKVETSKSNPAIDALDRLLVLSPSPPIHKHEEPEKNETIEKKSPEILPQVDETMAKELKSLRSTVQEQLEKQKQYYVKLIEEQKQYYTKLLEEQKNEQHENVQKISELEDKVTELQEKINHSEKQLATEIQNKNQLNVVVDEYEKSISRLVSERESEKKKLDVEKNTLLNENQELRVHIAASEAAFNDVHAKYEKLKVVVTTSKNNEIAFKESLAENIETIKKLENRYEQIKIHANTQLEKANHELEAIQKQHNSETVKLRAMLRKEELKSNSLAEALEQKTKENKELTKILDEVIAKVDKN